MLDLNLTESVSLFLAIKIAQNTLTFNKKRILLPKPLKAFLAVKIAQNTHYGAFQHHQLAYKVSTRRTASTTDGSSRRQYTGSAALFCLLLHLSCSKVQQ